MNHRIVGTTMPVLEVTLDPGDAIRSVAGELSWMSGSISLKTTAALAGSGGLFGLARRAMGGGSIFMTEYSAAEVSGLVAFATKVPGNIFPVELRTGREFVIHRRGFLCATPGVQVGVALQRKFGPGIFGGEGFVLQKISGEGQAWIELSGEVVSYDLQPGETWRVHPGHVGMFEASVGLGVTMLRGVRNLLFGGDGLFLCTLTGPGKIWLQSLPAPDLAHAISGFLPPERQDELIEEHDQWATDPTVDSAALDGGVVAADAAAGADWGDANAQAGEGGGADDAQAGEGGGGDTQVTDGDDFHEGDTASTMTEGAVGSTDERFEASTDAS